MKRKKIFKIIGLILGVIILSIAVFLGFGYYYYQKAYDTENKSYKNYVGYIDQDKALLNNKYELCNESRIYHTYSSAGFKAYSGTKKQFREAVNSEFNTNNYTDSGYLNFRFLVNCEGNPGWFEIIQMNLDLEESSLNQEMVNELFKFTANPNHWNSITYDEIAHNYYMYISYRIENGKVTEIIP
jgi:hypothetical protein